MKVYYMNVKSINADDEKWFKYLSQKRIEKVNRLKKANKKSQSIGAELLLNYAVNGDIKKTVKWDTENGGKLYLTQNKDLYVIILFLKYVIFGHVIFVSQDDLLLLL